MNNTLATIILFIAFGMFGGYVIYSFVHFQRKIWRKNLNEEVVEEERRNYFKKFIFGAALFLLLFIGLGLLVNFG